MTSVEQSLPTGSGIPIRRSRLDFSRVLVFAILAKPIVDLFWQVELFGGGPFGLNPQRILALLVPLLCGAILFTQRRVVILREPLLYAFMALTAIAMLANGANQSAVDQFLRWFAILAVLAVALTALKTETELLLVLQGLVFVSLVPTMVTYLQTLGIVPFYFADFVDLPFALESATGIYATSSGSFSEGIGRASGGYQHPTGYTFYVFVAIPAAYALLRLGRIRLRTFVLFLAVTLPAVFFTYDRAGYLVIAVQLLAVVLLSGNRRTKLLVGGLGVTALLIAGPLMWHVVTDALFAATTPQELFRGRGLMWILYGLHWMEGTRWQQAIGFGGVELADVPISFGLPLSEPHSDFVRVGYTYGIVGLLCYLWLILRITRGAWQMARDRLGSEAGRTVGVVCLMLVASLVISSVIKEPLRYTNFGWPFALLSAAALARKSGISSLR